MAVSVTVETVGVVPPPPPPPLPEPLPQPESRPKPAAKNSTSRNARATRRLLKTKSSAARANPETGKNGPRFDLDSADALAVKVIVVVATPPPWGVTVVGLKLQVTPTGKPEQAKLTAELKPF